MNCRLLLRDRNPCPYQGWNLGSLVTQLSFAVIWTSLGSSLKQQNTNQSSCFAFLNVWSPPALRRGRVWRWDWVKTFWDVLWPEGFHFWRWFWELGCLTFSSHLLLLSRTRRRPLWKKQPLVLVCAVKLIKQYTKLNETKIYFKKQLALIFYFFKLKQLGLIIFFFWGGGE